MASQAEITTNYVSHLEGDGVAPRNDLVACLSSALGVTMAEVLPTIADLDDLAVTQQQTGAV